MEEDKSESREKKKRKRKCLKSSKRLQEGRKV